MILLVDAGNTRIKWAFLAGGDLLPGGNWPTRDAAGLRGVWPPSLPAARGQGVGQSAFPPSNRITAAVLACVAGDAVRGELAGLLEACGLPAHWVAPEGEAHGLVNRYQPPQSLGADRYAALVGAARRFRQDCVVVGVGTALTADMLTATGEFLGGCIVPGPDLMRAALFSGTAGVGPGAGGVQDFPRETGVAVDTGIALALAGVVEGMRARLARERGGISPPVVLTGGARARVRALLAGDVYELDELVLEGLAWIARDQGFDA